MDGQTDGRELLTMSLSTELLLTVCAYREDCGLKVDVWMYEGKLLDREELLSAFFWPERALVGWSAPSV